jgi:Protein of unknown function (DUF1194)
MMGILMRCIGLALLLMTVRFVPAAADERVEVDLELVLAVDISFSMDVEEQRLQRLGYIQTITAPEFLAAIRQGMIGTIALTYVEWAGIGEQTVVVPWTAISTPEQAAAFADILLNAPLRRVYRTSISTVIDRSIALFEDNGFTSQRRVIDVSGDGPNNAGVPVTEARDRAVAAGITINGLPLMLKRAMSRFDIEKLDEYYTDCVIGGAGAFVEPVRTVEQFPMAIRRKIIREVAEAQTALPLLRIADREPSDCLIGEKLWRERGLMDR